MNKKEKIGKLKKSNFEKKKEKNEKKKKKEKVRKKREESLRITVVIHNDLSVEKQWFPNTV